ncbi:DNA alkylation repair protein [Enterovibrio sp. ZSDZ35]|uniref:DNA alkylation repair protein n=1 Tax=Enterovibrio qingdaonensis TaxID=2899818 RepID=A0ABT5QLE1_9GAMM|nr:DNA alkylation repair protein [Enterovibrio sp. ZSDZ35]MDD1781802.1 DNA alkylation repair protein [Enterovibrio sp. ZSDZ35]
MNSKVDKYRMNTVSEIVETLQQAGNTEIAEHSGRFFKSGPGEYGEGDKFLGIRVPVVRQFAKQFKNAELNTLSALLDSEWHEVRLLALVILSEQFKKAIPHSRKGIYDFYLAHTSRINNWDLVDCSAHIIVGGYLADKDRDALYTLAASSSLWERRIAMMATFTFIRAHQFNDTLELAELLLKDKEDLIHKMCGWMLREMGKRDVQQLKAFLDEHVKAMPRTMLRYAIEKLSKEERQDYLTR